MKELVIILTVSIGGMFGLVLATRLIAMLIIWVGGLV